MFVLVMINNFCLTTCSPTFWIPVVVAKVLGPKIQKVPDPVFRDVVQCNLVLIRSVAVLGKMTPCRAVSKLR